MVLLKNILSALAITNVNLLKIVRVSLSNWEYLNESAFGRLRLTA
jgi:hypothetical protein